MQTAESKMELFIYLLVKKYRYKRLSKKAMVLAGKEENE